VAGALATLKAQGDVPGTTVAVGGVTTLPVGAQASNSVTQQPAMSTAEGSACRLPDRILMVPSLFIASGHTTRRWRPGQPIG
jgi:hypothetical protein